jgi:hypothetical protein
VRARVVLGLLIGLAVAGLLAVLSASTVRLAGTSHVRTAGFNVRVPGGAEVCQPATSLAAGAGAARLLVGTYGQPVPPLAVRFEAPGGGVLAQGRHDGGGREGYVTVPFAAAVEALHPVARACVRNLGATPVALGGDVAAPAAGARIAGGEPQGVVAFAYPRAHAESWWPRLGEMARRFGVGKAPLFGAWTLPLLALALAGLWVATVRLLLRELPR